MPQLEDLGWDAGFQQSFSALAPQDLEPARVVTEHRDTFVVHTGDGEYRAAPAGRLRHAIEAGEAPHPAVGDWVAVRARRAEAAATIHAVLPRRTAVGRQAAGRPTGEQVLAANVDVLFVVTALDGDFNPRRIERYLTLVWDSGALPVVLLTKTDRCDDVEAHRAQTAAVAPGVTIHAISALAGQGLESVRAILQPGRTGALLGSSGVGKSTLVNALVGSHRLPVGEVRADDGRGRHTTVARQLIAIPGGGMLIDTPGLRELQLWSGEEAIDRVFEDIEEFSGACRFEDCRHESEPGCAVQDAVRDGRLDRERLASRRKLERELEFEASKRDAELRASRSRKVRQMHRQLNTFLEQRRRVRGGES